MPLNKDVDDCVIRYIALTVPLSKDDSKKFSTATLNHLVSAYSRVLGPVLDPNAGTPTSKRIIQDVEKCWGEQLLLQMEQLFRGLATEMAMFEWKELVNGVGKERKKLQEIQSGHILML